MKCRINYGCKSTVVSSNRRGVALLGALLQDVHSLDLFAICTEDLSGNRLWWTLWYRKPNGDIQYSTGLHGLAYVLFSDVDNLRQELFSALDQGRRITEDDTPNGVEALRDFVERAGGL